MTLPLPPEDAPASEPTPKVENSEAQDAQTIALSRLAANTPDGATLPLGPAALAALARDFPQVPGYEILRMLGRGGMGVVYQARHLKLQRIVALKMILAGAHAGEDDLARFRTEAEAVARLQHPGIVQIYEVGEHLKLPFLSLEYCAGGSLADHLDGTPMPARQAAHLVEQMARAIQVAHANQVVHRDLKPANVLLGAKGEPKISDFGLAKKLDEASRTQSGSVIGTPSYMAPEQAGGQTAQVGHLADVYALGAILYELLTGRPPFKAATAVETILQVVNVEPVPPTQLQPKTPRDLETICLTCLQKSPAKRYATTEALAEDLRAFQAGEPIRAHPIGTAERTWRWCRRNPAVALLLTTVAATLLLGIAVASWFAVDADQERKRAKDSEQRALDEKDAADVARRQSETDRDMARKAARDGQEKLLEARLAEALARRFSGQTGQRYQSLAALTQAVKLAGDLHKPASLFDQMRNLAIVSLALPDFRLEKDWQGWPEGSFSLAFDDMLEHYARTDLKGNITVRRLADDAETARLPGNGNKVWVRFGQGQLHSHLLLFDESDRFFKLWNFATHKLTQLAQPPGKAIVSWRLTTDGTHLVTLHGDGALNVFELPSGQHKHTIRFGMWTKPAAAETGRVFWHMHPFKHELAITMGPNVHLERQVVRIVDLDKGKVTAELRKPTWDETYCLAWHADGNTLSVGYQQSVVLWNVFGRRPRASITGHKGGGLNTAMNRTGEILLTHSEWAGGMKLWHPHTRKLLLSMPANNFFCHDSTRDGRLFTHHIEGTRLRLFVIDPARACRTLVRDPVRILPVEYRLNAIHRGGRLAAVGTSTGVTLLDLATGVDVGHLDVGHNWNVAFVPSTGELLTCSPKGLFRWPVQAVADAPGRLRVGPPKRLPITSKYGDHLVRTSADGKTVAVTQGQRVLVWHQDQPDRTIIIEPLEDVRTNFALSPDGQWLATGRHGGFGADVRLWNARDGKLVKTFGIKEATCVSFSPDGHWLVANDRTRFYFWRVGIWEPGPQVPPKTPFGEHAFSPDSRLLALERGDGAMRLIEVATGRELAVLEDLQQGRSTYATFSPDGTQLLLTNTDHQVLRLWDLRKVREGLKTLGLDWDAPPYPPAQQHPSVLAPLLVDVDLGPQK